MRRVLTPGWLAGHVGMLVLVVGMLGLAGWQFDRAAAGNALSWGYMFQWPVFAGFVVFIWARELRRTLRPGPGAGPIDPPSRRSTAAPRRRPVITRTPSSEMYDDRDDPDLAAYNRYLARLGGDGARPGDHPD